MSRIAVLTIIVLAIVFALIFFKNPYSSVNVPLSSIDESFTTTQLENGLTITVKEMHATPLATIQFWINTGGRNEPEDLKGIAHIFEHIWFKGTATQPVGSFHSAVESVGGELNAMTSYDWTVYFATVPKDSFDTIFPLMVDLLKNPLFDAAEVEKEKEVVIEEQRFSFNEPVKYVDEQFGLLLIDSHPYRHPVIGYKDTINASTREKIIEFYNTWYVPNNMNIVVAGDVNTQETTEKIRAAFKDLETKELPELLFSKQEIHQTPRYKSSSRDVGYTYIALGYVGPSAQEEDRFAMHVLNTIFSEGESSRLQKTVKTEKNLITEGGSIFIALKDMGVFETVAVIEPEKKGEAITEILVQLNKFKNEKISEEELERAKKIVLARRVKSQEEVFSVGFEIGQAWINGNMKDYSNFVENINKVTQDDVQRAAQKYITAHTIVEVNPTV